jgi:drug/metabolite transporter (DMT)-like permease
VTKLSTRQADFRLAQIGPAVLGATSFACADVLVKVVLIAGAGVLTMSAIRAVVGIAMLFVWLKLVPRAAFSRRATWISLGLGLLFAGNVFLLFLAIEAVDVPIAILTYFVYPLLTGLAAAATRLETITWRGAAAAVAAFLGLALMIGAHPTSLAATGILAALGAAVCRVLILLLTRAFLSGADPLRITWYSLLSSTAVFLLTTLAAGNWQPPATTAGWLALLVLSAAITAGLLGVFASTVRIGPFRTALLMNLEPPLTAIGSALFLGEVLTPLQMLGGGIMLGALVMFQLRR